MGASRRTEDPSGLPARHLVKSAGLLYILGATARVLIAVYLALATLGGLYLWSESIDLGLGVQLALLVSAIVLEGCFLGLGLAMLARSRSAVSREIATHVWGVGAIRLEAVRMASGEM